MIDPTKITNFDRTDSELQEFFLFAIVAAGKTAIIQAKKLEEFLTPAWNRGITPFEYIEDLINKGHLRSMICEVKLGQYNRITAAFEESIKLDLTTATTKELERIPGVGPKTSRFFLLHTRPFQQFAVLDTHILAWLKENVKDLHVPKTTPQSASRYRALEKVFLEQAEKLNMNPEDLDIKIWRERGRRVAV